MIFWIVVVALAALAGVAFLHSRVNLTGDQEAAVTLEHYLAVVQDEEFVSDQIQRRFTDYLTKLRLLYQQVSTEFPLSVVHKRLQWIIIENVPKLHPYLLNSAGSDESFAHYETQLAEVVAALEEGDLGRAAAAADQQFNWEDRDYFSL